MTMTATAEPKRADAADPWNGFQKGLWQKEINVRDFIQQNFTPYESGAAFLAPATQIVESFDFTGKTSRQCRIEIKLAPQRRDIPIDHAGHVRPPSSVSTAREKRPHTLRRSASAAEPALVSE